MEKEFKDDFIKAVVAKGSRRMPNDDFENQLMSKIQAANDYKKEVSVKLMLSLKFFVGALVLGLIMILSLLFERVTFSYNLKHMAVGALFIIALMGILNIENYKRLIRKYSTS
ncbi:MAG: hypothetical protein AAGA64_12620 [Bacteroidota bacterium]